MEIDEKQEFTSPLPVLPRLDRLDRLLQLLEEKHNALSEKHIPEPVLIGDMGAEEKQEDKTCRTLSNALDEVHHKGTLMERLEMLEKRVLQLSLEIDEHNTSKSSTSSIVAVSEKFGNSSGLSSVTKDDQDVTSSTSSTLEGRPDPLLAHEDKVYAQAPATTAKNRNNSRKQKTTPSRKWNRCFRVES